MISLFMYLSLVFFMTPSHDYYFAFAEIEYNKETNQFEISIQASAHDFENYLIHEDPTFSKLEEINNPVQKHKISKLISDHFSIQLMNNELLNINLEGIEITNTDKVNFYLTSNKIEFPKTLQIRFDLMMDFFENQQNKIKILHDNGPTFLTYLPQNKIRKIEF